MPIKIAPPYTVQLLPGLADLLDRTLAPGDTIEALSSAAEHLPALHSELPRKRSHFPGELPFYFARYCWLNLGFTYVELGPVLLIVDLWEDQWWNQARETEVDCVLDDGSATRRRDSCQGPSCTVGGGL